MKKIKLYLEFAAVTALTCFVGMGSETAAFADEGTGLQTSLAVDIVGKTGQAGPGTSDRLDVREAELLFFAPTDHLFDGLLNLAAHQEATGAFFEVHEANVGSTKLIPRSRFKLGQYFLNVGRLNPIHRHDWPFLSSPMVQREFFDEEALSDTGLEYSILLPAPIFLDLTAGITNGWVFGHTHNQGQAPHFPTHYAKLATYFDLPGDGGIQTALNYLGRKASDGTKITLLGIDTVAKWREGRRLIFLLQGELWHRALTPSGAMTQNELGLYVYPQYGFTDSLQLGLRVDYFTNRSLQDASGSAVSNGTFALVPTLTYRPSEFTVLRAAYTQEWTALSGTPTIANRALEIQTMVLMGTHPAHEF